MFVRSLTSVKPWNYTIILKNRIVTGVSLQFSPGLLLVFDFLMINFKKYSVQKKKAYLKTCIL